MYLMIFENNDLKDQYSYNIINLIQITYEI